MADLKTQISTAGGAFFKKTYGREVLLVLLHPPAHASFVCVHLVYKQSVSSATLNHFKGSQRATNMAVATEHCFLKTAETPTKFALAVLQSCWLIAFFEVGTVLRNWAWAQHDRSSLRWISPYFPVDFSFDVNKTFDGNIDPNPLKNEFHALCTVKVQSI